MLRKVLRSKLHRATVTDADLDYEGSITLPVNLMEAAGIAEYEAVSVWNISNGSRLETYAIKNLQTDDYKTICMNGAAAHLTKPGDLVIIACFNFLEQAALETYLPKIVLLDENNAIKEERQEIPGPISPSNFS